MLTRIRNALVVGHSKVAIPASRLKAGIADSLKREGFITDFTVKPDGKQGTIEVTLKYGPDGEKVIQKIMRVSKPGCRVYKSASEIKKVLNGYGAELYTTTAGVLSDRECRAKKVGGEVLLRVS